MVVPATVAAAGWGLQIGSLVMGPEFVCAALFCVCWVLVMGWRWIWWSFRHLRYLVVLQV